MRLIHGAHSSEASEAGGNDLRSCLVERITTLKVVEGTLWIEGMPLVSQIPFPFAFETVSELVAAENLALNAIKLAEQLSHPVLANQFANNTFGMAPVVIEFSSRVRDVAVGDGMSKEEPISGQPHGLQNCALFGREFKTPEHRRTGAQNSILDAQAVIDFLLRRHTVISRPFTVRAGGEVFAGCVIPSHVAMLIHDVGIGVGQLDLGILERWKERFQEVRFAA